MAMFENTKEVKKGSETIIGADVTLTGNIKSDGDIQINGKIKGRIDTKNDIFIGEQSIIDGSLKAKNIIITGTVVGNLESIEDLEIDPSGKVFGDIVAKNLIIKKGATFTGKSIMGEDKKKEIKPIYEVEETEIDTKEKGDKLN